MSRIYYGCGVVRIWRGVLGRSPLCLQWHQSDEDSRNVHAGNRRRNMPPLLQQPHSQESARSQDASSALDAGKGDASISSGMYEVGRRWWLVREKWGGRV
jgi:hypothetical protein